MSAPLELVELSRCDSDTIRFTWSEGHSATVPALAVSRSPHLYNIVASDSDEDAECVWVPEGSISVWLKYLMHGDDQTETALSGRSAEELMVLLKACDFFADEHGVQCVSGELGGRLVQSTGKHKHHTHDDSETTPTAEGPADGHKAKQANSGTFWTNAWKTCCSPRSLLEQQKHASVNIVCKALETLPTCLAIAIIKGSNASLGKCLQQLPERHHGLVLLSHFPSIEQASTLHINRATLQQEFTASTLQDLFDASLKFPTISTLDVSINNLFAHAQMLVTDEVAMSFKRALCRFNLTSLTIDGDLLTDPVVAAVADVILQQQSLQRLVLARNRWHTPVFSLSARLFDALHKCSALQHLELTEFRSEDCVSSWEVLSSSLASAILSLAQLKTLSLTRKSITASDLIALHTKAEQQEHSRKLLPELHTLDLSYNQLGPSGARALAPVLSHLSSLERIKLAMNGCGAQINMPVSSTRRRTSGELPGDGLDVLAAVFGQLKSLRHIDVTGNPYLSNQGAEALASAWAALSNLEHLDMSNCHAFPKGSTSMCAAVSHFTRLTYLDFTSFTLVDGYGTCAGACALADALMHHSSLQHLCLAATQLTADAIAMLAPRISHHTQLTTLDLQFDIEIGSRGVMVLSQHLSPLSNLQSLALACLDASDEAAAVLAATLPALGALRTLNLCHFRTASKGTDALTSAFSRMPQLEELLLADFGHCPASGVAKAVKSMTNLKKLNIGSNPIGDSESGALAEALQSATSLEWLNLSAHVNICSKEGLIAFISALDGHPSLQTCILSISDYLELPEQLRQPWVRLR